MTTRCLTCDRHISTGPRKCDECSVPGNSDCLAHRVDWRKRCLEAEGLSARSREWWALLDAAALGPSNVTLTATVQTWKEYKWLFDTVADWIGDKNYYWRPLRREHLRYGSTVLLSPADGHRMLVIEMAGR